MDKQLKRAIALWLLLGFAAIAKTYFDPLPLYPVVTKAFTSNDFDAYRILERRRVFEMWEELAARRVFERNGCDSGLA